MNRARHSRVAVYPEFARMIKSQAAINGKTLIKYTEELSERMDNKKEERKRPFDFKI
jgi:hypothetical protein